MPSHYPNHDDLHAMAMRNVAVAKDYAKNNLPAKILKCIAVDHMERLPDKLYGRIQKHFADALFQVPLVDDQGNITKRNAFLIFLAEHKSSPDRWLALQILRYMCEIWHDWLDEYKRENKQSPEYLPPIWPVTIYHGVQSPYPESTDMRDLFEDRSLAEAMLNEPFQLVDLTQIDDEELKKQGLAASFQLLHKHIFEQGNWDFVQELLRLIKPVAHLLGDKLLLAILQYMANYGKIDDKERFRRLVVEELPDYEEKLMSIAQQWREEGKQQGLQQGMQQGMEKQRQETIRQLLRSKKKAYTFDDIADVIGLTPEEVDALLNEDNE